MRVFIASFSMILRLTTTSLALLAASCGGSGGGDSERTPTTTPFTPTCGGVGLPPCALTISYVGTDLNRPAFGVFRPEVWGSYPGRVDLLVDGATAASTTIAAKQPGVSLWSFRTPWDTSNFSDGVHAVFARLFDDQGRSADTPIAAVVVRNRMTIPLTFSTDDIVPPPASSPTGAGELTVNLGTGEISGGFSLTGITTVDSAHLHAGYAGRTDAILLPLVRSGVDPNRWDFPTGSVLNSTDAHWLALGARYVDAHSSSRAYPDGALRAQVKPKGVQVFFASMTGAQVVPPVSTDLKGVVAVTIEGHTLSMNASAFDAGGRVQGTGAHAHYGPIGLNGPLASRFSGFPPIWTVEGGSIDTSRLSALREGSLYVVIDTTAHPDGEIRGQLSVPSVGTRLSELQTAIFTPKCASCHDGVGSVLPGSLDLREGKSYASLTGVISGQQSSLKLVISGLPAVAYLIHKVEGLPTITGDRMPPSGPSLTRDEIDAIRSWMLFGALDD